MGGSPAERTHGGSAVVDGDTGHHQSVGGGLAHVLLLFGWGIAVAPSQSEGIRSKDGG